MFPACNSTHNALPNITLNYSMSFLLLHTEKEVCRIVAITICIAVVDLRVFSRLAVGNADLVMVSLSEY